MNRTKMLLAATTWLAAACASAGCDEPVQLRLDPPAGYTLPLEAIVHQKTSQTVGGVDQTLEQEITYGYTQVVEGRGDDGSIHLVMTYDSFRAVTESEVTGRLVVDSNEPGPDPLSRAFANAMGESVSMRLDANGDVLEVGGVSELVEAMVAGLDPTEAAALRGAVEAQFGEESIKRLVEPFLSIYPEGPVRVGDRWERRVEVDAVFPHVQENAYELASCSGGLARIEMTSTLTPSPSAEPVAMGTLLLEVSLEGEQSGRLLIDEATGMAVGMELEQELQGHMRPVGDDEAAGYPMKVTGRIEMKRRD